MSPPKKGSPSRTQDDLERSDSSTVGPKVAGSDSAGTDDDDDDDEVRCAHCGGLAEHYFTGWHCEGEGCF